MLMAPGICQIYLWPPDVDEPAGYMPRIIEDVCGGGIHLYGRL